MPAAFLATIEETLGWPSSAYFDLIAGTSTGGILALGLALGYSAADLLKFYRDKGPIIFGQRPPRTLGIFKPKHSAQPLQDALAEKFGTKKISDCRTRLLIPSFDATKGEIHIYKTRHHPKLDIDYKLSAVEVAMATTAAPHYLPSYKSSFGSIFVDGGLWANNPVGIAVVEAITLLGQAPTDLRVLSLGCGQVSTSFSHLQAGKDWALNAIEAALIGQSGGSLGTAQSIASHEHVKRINPYVPPLKFALNDARGIDELQGIGVTEARKYLPDLKTMFFANKAMQFIAFP